MELRVRLALAVTCKVDVLDLDLVGVPAVAVLVGVASGSHTPADDDAAALAEVPGDKLGSLPPCNAVDKVSLLLAVVIGLVVAVNGDREAAYRHIVRRAPEIRSGGEPPLNDDLVKHSRHLHSAAAPA